MIDDPYGNLDGEEEEEGLPEDPSEEEEEPEEGEPEGEPATEGEGEEEPKPKEPMIPKSRFDAAVQQARRERDAAEAKLKEREEQAASTQQAKEFADEEKRIDELQDKYEELIFEGKKVEASQVRREVKQLSNALAERKAQTISQRATAAAVESIAFNGLVDKLEAEYPQIDANSDQYDEKVEHEVATMVDAYMRLGMTRVAALQKAAGYVLGSTVKVPEPEPEPKAEPAVKGERQEAARKRAAKAATAQPTDTSGAGLPSDRAGGGTERVRSETMTMAQFDKLSEEQKAALRGDVVE